MIRLLWLTVSKKVISHLFILKKLCFLKMLFYWTDGATSVFLFFENRSLVHTSIQLYNTFNLLRNIMLSFENNRLVIAFWISSSRNYSFQKCICYIDNNMNAWSIIIINWCTFIRYNLYEYNYTCLKKVYKMYRKKMYKCLCYNVFKIIN